MSLDPKVTVECLVGVRNIYVVVVRMGVFVVGYCGVGRGGAVWVVCLGVYWIQ